jgi:hypothetical protein
MQRHGHNQHFAFRRGQHGGKHRCEPRGQTLGDGFDAVVFQQVNQAAQRTLVRTESHSLFKGRWDQFAGAAEFRMGSRRAGRKLCDAEVFSAAGTEIGVLGPEKFPA